MNRIRATFKDKTTFIYNKFHIGVAWLLFLWEWKNEYGYITMLFKQEKDPLGSLKGEETHFKFQW